MSWYLLTKKFPLTDWFFETTKVPRIKTKLSARNNRNILASSPFPESFFGIKAEFQDVSILIYFEYLHFIKTRKNGMRAVQTICYDHFLFVWIFCFSPFIHQTFPFEWRIWLAISPKANFVPSVYFTKTHDIHYCLHEYMQSSYPRCHWRNTIIYAIRQFLIRIAWRTGHAGSFRIDLPASVFFINESSLRARALRA